MASPNAIKDPEGKKTENTRLDLFNVIMRHNVLRVV